MSAQEHKHEAQKESSAPVKKAAEAGKSELMKCCEGMEKMGEMKQKMVEKMGEKGMKMEMPAGKVEKSPSSKSEHQH